MLESNPLLRVESDTNRAFVGDHAINLRAKSPRIDDGLALANVILSVCLDENGLPRPLPEVRQQFRDAGFTADGIHALHEYAGKVEAVAKKRKDAKETLHVLWEVLTNLHYAFTAPEKVTWEISQESSNFLVSYQQKGPRRPGWRVEE